MRATIQVGLLTVIAAALLIGSYMFLEQTVLKKPSYKLYAKFPDAMGLRTGTKILMAGVNVGSIESVELNKEKALVKMRINEEIKIDANSVAVIPSGLLFPADMRIDIIPPGRPSNPRKPSGNYLVDRSEIKVLTPSALSSLSPEVETTVKELNMTLEAFRKIIADEKVNQSIRDSLINLNISLQNAALLTDEAKRMLKNNQGNIRDAIKNIAAASSELSRTLKNVNEIAASPQFKSNLKDMIYAAKTTAENASKAAQSLNELLSDPLFKESIKQTAHNAKEITDVGKDISENIKDITKTGKSIAVNADKVAAKADLVMDDIKIVSSQAIDIADGAQQLIDRLNEVAESIPVFKTTKPITPSFRLDFIADPNNDAVRTDAVIKVPYKRDFIHVGLFDATVNDKLIAQYDWHQSPALRLRFGVYASKPSVGVDYRLSPKLNAIADLYDPNDPQFDIRIKYSLGDEWGLWAGIDSALNNNNPIAGVSLFK